MPTSPDTEERLMIDAPPRSTMDGTKAATRRSGALTLTASRLSIKAASRSTVGSRATGERFAVCSRRLPHWNADREGGTDADDD